MSYFERIPLETSLHSLIECFWVHQVEEFQPPSQTHRIVPDGCMDVIYRLPHVRFTANLPHLDKRRTPTLVGTMTQPILNHPQPTHDYLGVRFRPGGIAAFIDKPLHIFTDTIGPVDAVHPSLGTFIQRQLEETQNWADRILLLETHLTDALRLPPGLPVSFPAVVQYILDQNGQTSLLQLSRVADLSPRQLERLFQRYIGVSPKLLARIVRFRHVKAILDMGTTDSLMGVAFDNGYTDHAHLTKEFSLFAGLTPSAYLG